MTIQPPIDPHTNKPFGRGAWTKYGMPSNGTGYYSLIVPENIGAAGVKAGASLSDRAVNWGVKAIQTRINELGFSPKLIVDGWLGPMTATAIRWVQGALHITADGEAGPITGKHLFWPYINSQLQYTAQVRQIVGGISSHESGYDPGAVGYTTPDDLGLVQINGPANPTLTEAARFDYKVAYKYALDRITAAIHTPGWTVDAAIVSYGYPSVATYWVKSKTETYPNDPALNILAINYRDYVKNWTPGF